MKKNILKVTKIIMLVTFILGFNFSGKQAFAATLKEKLEQFFNHDISDYTNSYKLKLDDFTLMPFRYITVKGDAAKFRALNWMNDGTTGGIKDMSFEGDSKKGDHLYFEGHAIPGDNDLGAVLKFTKSNGGYINVDYGNFRRFYDNYGGYFSDFSSKSISKLAADPKMDVGHFNLEIGNAPEKERGISLGYQHFSRDGIKNMLDWGTAQEGVKQRKIVPSWEEVAQTTDTIALKARTEIAGFKVNGEQKAEFFSGRTFREDDSSKATTPAFTSQEQEPQAKQLISSFKADRWTIDDNSYMAFAYQYQHLRNDQSETLRNYNALGATTGNARNVFVDAETGHDSNTWIQHFTTNLMPNLNFITKFKEEIVSQTGTSFAQGYGPSSVTNYTLDTENNIARTGEAFSLRYSGIPKTSLYTDWDFGQTRNWLSKWQKISTSASATYYENVDKEPEMTGVVGVRYVPNSKLNMTSQIRRQSKNNTYDTFANNDPAITISKLQTDSNEWDSRLTWKLSKWFQNSFRLQLIENVFHTQSLDQVGFTAKPEWLKSQGTSRVYTYNAVLQPSDQWMFDAGVSLNRFKVSTPASEQSVDSTNGGIPVFVADVYTALLSTSYTPKDNLSFYSSAEYSRANDFNAQSFNGIPFGVNNEHYDVTLGAKWSPKKDFTLEPHFGYYAYTANPNDNYSVDYGSYTAQVYWLDTTFNW